MCGVLGVIGHPEASYETYRGLLTLQHRGQDAAGILSYDSRTDEFHLEKDLGLVSQVFNEEKISRLKGSMAIGHTRYSTVGAKDRSNTQPMTKGFPFGIGMAHNGNIVNMADLQKELKVNNQIHSLTKNDLEVLLNLICRKLSEALYEKKSAEVSFEGGTPVLSKADFFKQLQLAVKDLFVVADGGYSVVGVIANFGLFAFRDPHGIRPLLLGRKTLEHVSDLSNITSQEISTLKLKNESHCFSSETVAFDFLGYEKVRDLAPGELMLITEQGEVFAEILMQKQKSPCMFEWIYFSSPESEFEGTSIYQARLRLGEHLGQQLQDKLSELDIDVVVPVPDTSRTAAISLAEELKIPYREVLIKNRYVQRSFILSSQKSRASTVDVKLSPVKCEIKGKNILLVDDSLVRGTTSQKIIQLLKNAGAKKVYLALTSPPLKYPCFYGIDFPNSKELMAAELNTEQVAQKINADHVEYLSMDNLKKSLHHQENLCTGCLTGKYPTCLKGAQNFTDQRQIERGL